MNIDRRGLFSAAATSLAAASVPTAASAARPTAPAASVLKPVPSDSPKAWARANLRGCESLFMPSMAPNLVDLDEDGVRRDVDHVIRQGMVSLSPVSLGLDSTRARRFRQIVAEQARGRVFVVGSLAPGPGETQVEKLRSVEALGCRHGMLSTPGLATQEAIYQNMKSICEQTSLAVMLYANPQRSLRSLDPTGVPLDAFDRLADLPNVVGVKLSQNLHAAAAVALAERVGDRLLLAGVDLELAQALALKYPMQLTGQWGVDTIQSPEKPYAVEFMKLLGEGKLAEAQAVYWRFEPAATAFYRLQGPSLALGGHPWLHMKYLQWLTGGNGGLLADLKEPPEVVPPLDAAGRRACRNMMESVGIQVTARPEEAFVVGNAAYDRGTRASAVASLPQYVA